MKEADGHGLVPLDEATVAAVNDALHESQVSGFRVADDGSVAELLVLVDTLPEAGPMEQARRVVVMHDPSRIRIVLRRTGRGDDFYEGPMLILQDVAELDRFFAHHITWAHEMYSCDFLDGSAEHVADWPTTVSLELAFATGRADHSLYWWVECGRNADDAVRSYWLQGFVEFGAVEVHDELGTRVSLAAFGEGARRWWRAFHDGDARVGAEAQREARKSEGWQWWQAGRTSIAVPANAWPNRPGTDPRD